MSARDVLERRNGWLEAYLELAGKGDSVALSIDGLLKPSHLFEGRV